MDRAADVTGRDPSGTLAVKTLRSQRHAPRFLRGKLVSESGHLLPDLLQEPMDLGHAALENEVTVAQVQERMAPVAEGAPALAGLVERFTADAATRGWLLP